MNSQNGEAALLEGQYKAALSELAEALATRQQLAPQMQQVKDLLSQQETRYRKLLQQQTILIVLITSALVGTLNLLISHWK